MPMNALAVLCAHLTRDLFATAKFLLSQVFASVQWRCTGETQSQKSSVDKVMLTQLVSSKSVVSW